MKLANLTLHCGANEVSMDNVRRVQTPAATDTHYPVPHEYFIDAVRTQFEEAGMEVVHEAHALRRNGNEYFGLLQVKPGNGPLWAAVTEQDDYALVTGLRNSHIKTFSAGLAMGANVFCCDNLSLSGTVNLRRKHSVNILRDLPAVINRAIGQLACMGEHQEQRMDAYKATTLSDMTVRDFVVRAMENQVIGCTLIPKVLAEWHRPSHEDFAGRDAWSLFNAFTEVLKQRGLFDLPDRTTRLHGQMDLQCGLAPMAFADTVGIEADNDTDTSDTLEVVNAV